MEPIKVIVRFMDGKVMKGYANDFNPIRPSFHFNENVGSALSQPILIEIKDLKAIFFVRTFEGNSEYAERNNFMQGDLIQGRKAEVTFPDGEVIRGSTMGYDAQRLGFFLVPVDPKSNNIRIFVVTKAVKNFRFL
ncbi:MAG TPA: hypothetical protein VMU10_09900 [Desulfomonilia bacterium]|nr:hypothetical protein [Desulfomonilia bacterium]